MPKVVKNSCGYRVETLLDSLPPAADPQTPGSVPLQKLFVGAEGTLGLVTEAKLRLTPLPPKRGIAMAYFSSVFAVWRSGPGYLEPSPHRGRDHGFSFSLPGADGTTLEWTRCFPGR